MGIRHAITLSILICQGLPMNLLSAQTKTRTGAATYAVSQTDSKIKIDAVLDY